MANQITIDIVAETKKLTSGIDETNKQLTGLKGGIDKTQQAAVGLASAFILKTGISFAKKASEEFIDAEKTAAAAEAAFGKNSVALQKITQDAEKFAKELAIDNDELIKLATGLGVRLPADAQSASTELVLLAKNLEAASAGNISAETTLGKLGKAFKDGDVNAKELKATIPGLTDSVYDQAAALSKAGKNQEAMTLLVEAGQVKYGGAAAAQVTASQRMEKAMGDLYEMIGKYVAPVVEKLSKFLQTLIEFVIRNKDVIIPLVAVLGTFAAGILILNAGLTAYNAIMAAWKVATTLATTAQTIFNAVMAANPIALVILAIVAIIAIIVLLVKNWDTVTETAKKVWEAIKEFFGKAYEFIKEAIGKAIDWVKQNWPLILAILTGPIGLAIKAIVDNFDKIKDKVKSIVENIKDFFGDLPGKMMEIGKNIVTGLWNGMQNMVGWLRDKVTGFFKNLLPSWAEKALGIASPSKVFAGIGKNIIGGLQSTFNAPAVKAVSNRAQAGISVPSVSLPSLMTTKQKSAVNITINAGLGTNGPALGRQVSSAIKQYGKVSTKAVAF